MFEVEVVDHIVLTVADLKEAYNFYSKILGFKLSQVPVDYPDKISAGSYYFSVGGTEIALLVHFDTSPSDRFSEFRVGLDHLAFRVKSEDDLQDLVERLNQHSIANQGIQTYQPNGKKYVVLRDPDNIQLEYWLDQPGTEQTKEKN